MGFNSGFKGLITPKKMYQVKLVETKETYL